MNVWLGATLVVLSSVEGCKVDNVDTAEVSYIRTASMEECEEQAAILDKKRGQRAFCIPD